jgi:eukaryotic-like serine/threonine-protein kinase
MRGLSCSAHYQLIATGDNNRHAHFGTPSRRRGGRMTTSWRLAEGAEIVPGRCALRLLGGGRRYEAYLAWDEHLHALVVAKLLRPDQAHDARALRQLAEEAELLASLAHPLLIRSFGALPDGPRPHVVLEHVEGPRLSTLIRRHGIALEQLLPVGLELVRLLRYLEAERVLHLDVKPRNIIMAGRPRLIDLSVARRLGDLGRLDAPVGTEPYMAPEQCEVERFGLLGPATDVWGVGATLYEALTGAPPFPADGEPFPQLRHPPSPLPRHVPGRLAGLVLDCLTPQAADRPTLGELSAGLETLVDRLPNRD